MKNRTTKKSKSGKNLLLKETAWANQHRAKKGNQKKNAANAIKMHAGSAVRAKMEGYQMYKSIQELPDHLKKLPENVQEFYVKAYNTAEEAAKDTQEAARSAWKAVKEKFEDITEEWSDKH